MFDAACERIRQVAREHDLPLPDALRPDAALPHTKMYHVNMSGGARCPHCLAARWLGPAASACACCSRSSSRAALTWRRAPAALPPAVFRSAVDSWAIQQLFPIVPIHRLGEEPTVPAMLADLTCDSDGKVDKFINPKVRTGGKVAPCRPARPVPRLAPRALLATVPAASGRAFSASLGHSLKHARSRPLAHGLPALCSLRLTHG